MTGFIAEEIMRSSAADTAASAADAAPAAGSLALSAGQRAVARQQGQASGVTAAPHQPSNLLKTLRWV